ncbi:GTPase Era [Parvularcula sp. ZS-1/3]|uniref:GTPase Era n=1 Tax=Parvularcula mediterranea TaxID=2732508 RepID=A0A7Y3W5Z0_9PROT|nr:GTPase Era [Parvularcula mediterranea]NNU17124.1 GTPase Era [Parvularcula mediterranea]
MTERDERCGVVAVLGAPNAGKSTFVNLMVGAKVSIVTHKVQTTRARIRGVAMNEGTQIVYVDTPGIFKAKRNLDKAMVTAAWDAIDGSDLLLLMVDAPAYLSTMNDEASPAALKSAEDTDRIVETLKANKAKAVLVLNKIDRMPRQQLLRLAEAFNEEGVFTDTFMISAKKKRGTDDLKEWIAEQMPEGPYLYPDDQLSDINDRMMAAEVTREKLFLRLHEELPYSLTVETDRWERTKRGELRLEQTIYVDRDSQKKLVLGHKGRSIAAVGKGAREEMQEIFGETVHLFLYVKVREGWAEDKERLRNMGLEV